MLVPKKNRLAVYSFLFKGQQTAAGSQQQQPPQGGASTVSKAMADVSMYHCVL
jgi:hypothetical protein